MMDPAAIKNLSESEIQSMLDKTAVAANEKGAIPEESIDPNLMDLDMVREMIEEYREDWLEEDAEQLTGAEAKLREEMKQQGEVLAN